MSAILGKFRGFTSNQLKIFALLSMTCDHVGLQFFPDLVFLRIIGRFAFPIFAYMIAEGCQYTKNRCRYLLTILLFAVGYQLVYFFVMGSIFQCIFVSFTLSILLIYLLDYGRRRKKVLPWMLFGLTMLAVIFVSAVLPRLIPETGFDIDYGLWGILLPVGIYLFRSKPLRLAFAAADLAVLAIDAFWYQWFALLTIPLLALYNGKRGKWKLKYLFYIYYPLHLVVIYAISVLIW